MAVLIFSAWVSKAHLKVDQNRNCIIAACHIRHFLLGLVESNRVQQPALLWRINVLSKAKLQLWM